MQANGKKLDSRGIIDLAFASKPGLPERIGQALSQDASGRLQPLLTEIAHYVLELRPGGGGDATGDDAAPAKKRKLNDGAPARPHGDAAGAAFLDGAWAGTPIEGVSFTVPQRKKLALHVSPKAGEGIKAVNPATAAAEFGLAWQATECVLCLPVPEKAQAAKNFCVIPKETPGGDRGGPEGEPIVWTALDVKGRGDAANEPTPAESMMQALKAARATIVEPSDKEFASQLQQATRKGEKAYHVKAFRGSKDGFLFFLPTGILWGFKKPLLFLPFAAIASISYTSVLQRTFNLVVAALPPAAAGADAAPTEHEFSMLDQADFAGIDAYVRRHGLSDESMAAQRKAKRLNINGVKGVPPAEGAEGEEEDESELKKAEREAEMQADDDDDEEDDENFDPGSEGESEGSGTSEEEDEEGDHDGRGEEGLVADELGSEAEEVEMDDEEK